MLGTFGYFFYLGRSEFSIITSITNRNSIKAVRTQNCFFIFKRDLLISSRDFIGGRVVIQPYVAFTGFKRLVNNTFNASSIVCITAKIRVNLKIGVILRQLLPVKTFNTGLVVILHVRGGNGQAAFLVHISVLGTIGKRHIKDGGAAGFFGICNTLSNRAGFLIVVDIERVRCTVKINGLLVGLAVLCAPQGVIHPIGTRISLKPLVELLLAVFLHDLLDLAQLNGLVTLSVLFDVEGDLEVTGVRVIGTAAVGVILFGLLFGLFLRGLLRAGTFLALFLRVAGVSIAGAGGLLTGIALIFGVVLVLALDVVLVVLGGAGQGLYGLGLLRALNGGFVVRRGVVVRIAVGQRDNGHLQAGVIRVGQGFGCGGTAHANRAAEHRKGQRHRNDLLFLGLFSHNRPPHFTRDCVPRTTFQKSPAQNRRPLGSPYNPILYTFSKNFKGANCTKKSLHGNFG